MPDSFALPIAMAEWRCNWASHRCSHGCRRTPFLEYFPFRPRGTGVLQLEAPFQLEGVWPGSLNIIRQSRHMQPDSLICPCFIPSPSARAGFVEQNCPSPSPFYLFTYFFCGNKETEWKKSPGDRCTAGASSLSLQLIVHSRYISPERRDGSWG